MDLIGPALERSAGLVSLAASRAESLKAAGVPLIAPSSALGQLDQFRNDTAQRERYGLFRGWFYSAVHAIASEAAGQAVHVGRMKGGVGSGFQKSIYQRPDNWRKEASQQMEMLVDHPLVDFLEQPNSVQGRWQFVYSFVANLCLTGWSYIVGGVSEEGAVELYSLPTTWVRPDHSEGPFSKFRIINPKNPTAEADSKPLDRKNVGFAYLPNPSDPLLAMAPSASQMTAIKIDDNIQNCQGAFFENGLFPSVIVTVGKDPHPDVPAGIRPRLNASQRRQVMGAIRKVMGGVANYGNPAIVDGMIEKIERLSATQNEIGWEKSEGTVRTRILSSLGVHPYILGEPVGVGGYAQVANIEKRFYKRVNTYLEMLTSVVGGFVANALEDQESKRTSRRVSKPNGKMEPVQKSNPIKVWWEPCVPHDPSMHWSNLNAARSRGDVSRNEIRLELGLPPDETGGDQTKNFTSGDITAITSLQKMVADGSIEPKQAALVYQIAYDLSPEDAKLLAGKKPEKPAEPAMDPNAANPVGQPVPNANPQTNEPPTTEEEALEKAKEILNKVTAYLNTPVSELVEQELSLLDLDCE